MSMASRLGLGLFVLCLSGVIGSWRSLQSTAHTTETIQQWLAGKAAAPQIHPDPALVLAEATYYLKRDQDDEALERLRWVVEQGDRPMQSLAYYNLGNLHLRRALDAAQAGNLEPARARAELAKEAYRRSLTANPTYWDAKFNLEVAMRLVPEMERVDNGTELPDDQQAKRLWSSLPGFPRGLP